MKKSERILSALTAMALGVLFIVLQDNFIGVLMTVAGACLIVFGVVDILRRNIPQAIIKILSGLLLVVAGWVIAEAVLYILSGILLVFGTLYLYDQIKRGVKCTSPWSIALEYATPALCIAIGVLLLFSQTSFVGVICVVCGILTVLEGGVLLTQAFLEE